MTTRRELIAGLTMTAIALAAGATFAAEQGDGKPQFLFVQSAERMRYADGVLTLERISPSTVLFSDRPERLAGHMATNDFVPFWSEGEESFESDPPNANLSLLDAAEVANVVLTLRSPRLEAGDLSYSVNVLEGELPTSGGAVTLFIDIIGRPLTPVSFAGARRRMWRRAVY